MIWPLQPASYGLAGITLAISMATVSGSDTPGVQRLAAITAVLSLICLNGLSHLLDMPAETLLLAHAAYSGIPPGSGFILQANMSGGP
ncbi:TraX family protein [Enterobacter cloacae]|uniref:TraX family protein n=1 Tax=Enterobacter cloacae TaxID=550 RepID=A0A377LMW0_ENTCL|nr:TraX family protein [Enterobacter cloacae]